MYSVQIKLPKSQEIIERKCITYKEIAQIINETLFSGIEVVRRSSLYTLVSRPERVPTLSYKKYITIKDKNTVLYGGI